MTGRPAHVHAPAPGSLTQADQPLRGGLGLGAAGCRACAIFEVGDTRPERLLAEEPAECSSAAVQFQVSERFGYVACMTERNNPASHCMTDFVNSGTDGRFDMSAALCIGKSLPATPSLHHKKSL